jgi:hypothetical protein
MDIKVQHAMQFRQQSSGRRFRQNVPGNGLIEIIGDIFGKKPALITE